MSEKKLFELAADGWAQLCPAGDFPHKGAGVTQVLDREAFDAIKGSFDEASKAENFPGVLVDFDHFSMDTDKPSEAAGWITALDARDDGLWAQVRWSDSGLAAVTGGRFRLVSPVFPSPQECEDLGGGRIRPRRLVSVALTNEPNIKGSRPIANRKPDEAKGKDEAAGAKRLRWVLGEVKEGSKHCDVCSARAGQVKTAAEWAAMKAPVCHCHCTLESVEDEGTANRWTDEARAARKNFPGWSDAARAASAAARRAKAGGAEAEGGKPEAEAGEADGYAAAFIRQREGFETEAYPDPATGGAPWTVGFGSTRDLSGNPFKPGDRVTREEAEALLLRDMKNESAGLSAAIPWGKLNARQQAALMSWAYNIGGRAAATSTLARRLAAGEDPALVIREELPRWNKAGGRVMRGLTARRLAEVALAEGSPTANRWSDAARAARKNFPGWSDAARAAAAASRAAKREELQAKIASGEASPAERLSASLDAPFEDAEKRAPARYEGPSLSAGAAPADPSDDALYAGGETDLRDVVGAGPATGNGFLDGVTAGIGAATLLGGVSSGGKGGRNGLDAIRKSIARKQARLESVARSRARSYYQNTPASEWGAVAEGTTASSGGLSKVCRYLKEGVNASRALITSYDLSAALRQGGILSLSNPGKVPGAMAAMFKSLFSQKTAERVDAELRARPNAALYSQGGLYLSDGPGGSMSMREEAFCSELAKSIPGVQASERAFSAYLSRIRADCFDTMVESLCYGHTPTTAELQAISNYINVATGRGSLGSLEQHADVLSTVFFAPKLAASRFEFILGQPLTGGTTATRKLVAEQYGRYLVGLGVVYGLSQMAGGDVGTDTDSSDAGKIRVGENTRVDILSGLGQSLVFVSRLASGVYATTTGKEYDLNDPDGKVTRADVEWRFLQTKLSPLAAANVHLVTGKDIVGERVTPADVAFDLTVPLVARDVYEMFKEHQVPTATALSLLSVFGAGVAAYKSNRSKKARPDPDMPPVPTALDKLVSKDARAQAAYLEEARKEAEARKAARAVKKTGAKRRSSKKVKEDAMSEITMLKKTRRDGRKAEARAAGGTRLVTNRWTDAARAARKTFHGWSDSARAAAAAARAKRRVEIGGTHSDGRPVISDVIGAFDGNTLDPSRSYIGSGDDLAARQAAYAETFRKWWDGVERTSVNIAAFNAFVASLGGAAAGAAGAYRQTTGMSPSAGASQAFGRAGRYVTGKSPVYDESGNLTGFAGVGRRPYPRTDNGPIRQPYRKAGSLSADEGTAVVTDPATGRAVGRVRYDEEVPAEFFRGMRGMGPDPINNPTTPADFAFQASYGRYLDELKAARDAGMASQGLDPQGHPLASAGGGYDTLAEAEASGREAFAMGGGSYGDALAEYGIEEGTDSEAAFMNGWKAAKREEAGAGGAGRVSTGDAEADRVLELYDRVAAITPRTAEEVDAYGDVLEGLRAYGEMYEADRAQRDPGLIDRVAEKLEALEKGSFGSVREGADGYGAETLPYEEDGAAGFADPDGAAEAARALGVLHGSYGAGPEAADNIPESLLEDYVRGLEEGKAGYDYGVVTPADRSGVLRRARAFADGMLGDINDEYEADHIDDKYNAKKYADPEAWATRNNPDGAIYDPSQPDTRSQYSPQALMETALSWFSDSMVAGDKKAANAALSYMSDLMLGFAGDKAGVYRETVGDGDDDEAEIDSRVPLYDEDGNEIDADSPFYEDSYADPNARMPWDDELPFELRNRLFAVYPPLAPLPLIANARWTDEYRARVAARRAASAARTKARSAARTHAAAKRQAERQAKAALRGEKAAVRQERKDAKAWYYGEVAAAKAILDVNERAAALASAKTQYGILLQQADAHYANCTLERMYEWHPEYRAGVAALAFRGWKAEAERVRAQYDYDKLVAEQDGTELPEPPAMPADFGGFDFSRGVTSDMFETDEEFQAALAEWNATQTYWDGEGGSGGGGSGGGTGGGGTTFPEGPGADALKKAYYDRLDANDRHRKQLEEELKANPEGLSADEIARRRDAEDERWFIERENARAAYNQQAGTYGYDRLTDDGRWVGPSDPDYGPVEPADVAAPAAASAPQPADVPVVAVPSPEAHDEPASVDAPADAASGEAAPASGADASEGDTEGQSGGSGSSDASSGTSGGGRDVRLGVSGEVRADDEEDEEESKTAAANRASVGVEEEVRAMKADARSGRPLVNTGWTDAARAASLAVRRAHAAARTSARPANPPARPQKPRRGEGDGSDGGVYAGGSPDFDERTGQRRSSGGRGGGGSSPSRGRSPRSGSGDGSGGGLYAGGDPDFDERGSGRRRTGRELIIDGYIAAPVPEQEPLGFMPLEAYAPKIAAAKEARDYRKVRRLEHEQNEARKARAKAEYDSARAARLAERSRVYDQRKANPNWAPPSTVAAEPPVHFGGTIPPHVFYDGGGKLRDDAGNVVGDAPRAKKSGPVFYRGRWYDAATGKALRSGAANS